jgi:hypothetical protein
MLVHSVMSRDIVLIASGHRSTFSSVPVRASPTCPGHPIGDRRVVAASSEYAEFGNDPSSRQVIGIPLDEGGERWSPPGSRRGRQPPQGRPRRLSDRPPPGSLQRPGSPERRRPQALGRPRLGRPRPGSGQRLRGRQPPQGRPSRLSGQRLRGRQPPQGRPSRLSDRPPPGSLQRPGSPERRRPQALGRPRLGRPRPAGARGHVPPASRPFPPVRVDSDPLVRLRCLQRRLGLPPRRLASCAPIPNRARSGHVLVGLEQTRADRVGLPIFWSSSLRTTSSSIIARRTGRGKTTQAPCPNPNVFRPSRPDQDSPACTS